MRAIDAAVNVPWAIRPEALRQIIEIAARTHEPEVEAARMKLAARYAEIEGIAASPSKKVSNLQHARMRGSVAVMPIEGPIFRYSNLFSEMSGATSLESLALDFSAALKDDDVSAILLHVDSPGGEVNGTGEFADMVYKARGKKPIIAYVSHEGASAAYWIASAADRIIAAPTSILGSIGVVVAVPNPDASGKNTIQFVSSQSPNKRPDPTTKDGKEQIQGFIDDLAAEFISTVARNRGITPDSVVNDYGEGGVMVGNRAVEAGLADAIGSFEETLKLIDQDKLPDRNASPSKTTKASNETKIDMQAEVLEPVTDSITEQISDARSNSGDVETSTNESEDSKQMPNKWMTMVSEKLGIPIEAADGDVTAPVVTPPVVVPPVQSSASAVTATESVSEIARLREQLSAEQDRNARLLAERIMERADAFANRVITVDKKAWPSEKASLVALFVQAATDDNTLRQSVRVEKLEAAIASRPKHMMDEETVMSGLASLHAIGQIPGLSAGPQPTEAGKEMTAERRAELLKMTSVGSSVLAERTNGKN